jgi:hypothetical protein
LAKPDSAIDLSTARHVRHRSLLKLVERPGQISSSSSHAAGHGHAIQYTDLGSFTVSDSRCPYESYALFLTNFYPCSHTGGFLDSNLWANSTK